MKIEEAIESVNKAQTHRELNVAIVVILKDDEINEIGGVLYNRHTDDLIQAIEHKIKTLNPKKLC